MVISFRTVLGVLVAVGLSAYGAFPVGWHGREGSVGSGKALVKDASGLVLPVSLPGKQEYVMASSLRQLSLAEAETVVLTFSLPAEVPAEATVTVFSKDNDYLWRQIRRPLSSLKRDRSGRCVLEVPVGGQAAADAWESCGHDRPWTGLTARNLLELGFRLELDEGVQGSCKGKGLLTDVTVVKSKGWGLGKVRNFTVNTLQPQLGKRIDLSFGLDGWVTQPYDSAIFSIVAEISLPNGKKERVNGYYWEDFHYDETDAEKTSCLRPSGAPGYRVRYVPRAVGRHVMTVTVRQGKETLTLPPVTFTAQPAAGTYHGFVSVDAKHPQFFSYDDGTVFRGLGMNVRSPFDNRYFGVAPYSAWRDQGLQAYERLFRRYHEMGINVVEVWMCSWWLALEWTNDSPGFHGVGHYNQYRAWMLDRIMELAEENGIHIILVLNNHGKFGMTFDTEWSRNPYNRARGGYLKKCEDYFWEARAKADFKKTADYIVARWGASPNLLSWKLFTEVDLTGQNISAYLSDPHIPAWHQEMGAYFKTIDIYQHPITTHWMLSYQRIDSRVAKIKEVDFLSTDAYYQGGGSAALMDLIIGGADYGKRHGKPLVITEFGGSSYGDSMRNLMNQVELGLWTGFFHEMGILPMYWWFALVEDKDLYGHYRCLSKYEAGEDRRGMTRESVTVSGDKGTFRGYGLRGKDRLLMWVMDTGYFFQHGDNLQPAAHADKVIELKAPASGGTWRLECWNPANGNLVPGGKLENSKDGKKLRLTLPKFCKSLALKVLPSK